MSRQLRIRVVGLLAAVLTGVLAVAVVVPACSFEAPNLQDMPLDSQLPFDSPPDVFIPDAGPCMSLFKACVSGSVLRECQMTNQLPRETTCDWGCVDAPAPHCRVLTPSANAVTAADLDRTTAMQAGLQKRTFTSLFNTGTINTENGQISIGADGRQSGTGVRDGVDFKVVNGVGVFRFMELNLRGVQNIQVVGANGLALVAIDKITIGDGTQIDMRGTCQGRAAGPGGKQGGAPSAAGSGTGAGGAGEGTTTCSGGGGAGNSRVGAPGGNVAASNAGGTAGSATISVLTGGAGGGGGGGGGEGGGGGGAIQLVSNGPIVLDAGTLQRVGINAGGCGGNAGTCGGGGGAGGVILIEGRTVDFSSAFLAVSGGGGGGGGGSGAVSGEKGQVDAVANGGNGATPVGANNDGGDGGKGGYGGNASLPGGVRDGRGGGGGGGVGWIRINTLSGSIGQQNTVITPNGAPSASTGMANVQ